MRALFSLLILFSCTPLWAANVYVAPVQGTNISNNETNTLRELAKMQVQTSQEHQLVDSLEKADFYLQTKVVKFQKAYAVSITRWQNNKKVASAQARATDPSELENQIASVVQEVLGSQQKKGAIYKNQKSLSDRAEEKKQKNNFERVQARKQVTIGFGPTYFNNMNTNDTAVGINAGYVWNVDDHFDLGLQTDFAMSTQDSDAYMFVGKIVTNYFFAARDISPFIGAGFGYGFASIHNDNNSLITDDKAGGFAVSLQAGVKFFRTSNVNFAISGVYTNIFEEASLGQPGSFMLKVALLY